MREDCPVAEVSAGGQWWAPGSFSKVFGGGAADALMSSDDDALKHGRFVGGRNTSRPEFAHRENWQCGEITVFTHAGLRLCCFSLSERS